MKYIRQQDAFCPWCGETFRVRQHSKECGDEHMPLDEGTLKAIEIVSQAYVRWWYATHEKTLERVPVGDPEEKLPN
jgi:hypothetical protein